MNGEQKKEFTRNLFAHKINFACLPRNKTKEKKIEYNLDCFLLLFLPFSKIQKKEWAWYGYNNNNA